MRDIVFTRMSGWIPNGKRAQKYRADRRRAERGTVLGPLDAALLTYTGQYLHGATIPTRLPDAVDPALLPGVLRVIATAEQACAGMRIGRDPRRGKRATDKRDWERMTTTIDAAVRRAHPELVDDAGRTVSFLMCSEAADPSRNTPMESADDRADLGGSAGKGGADPAYRVEYSLVDGMSGYRNLVSTFVRGGCAALEEHGSWMSDVAEFERARRRRDAE